MKIFIITDIHYGYDVNYPDHGTADYINTYGSQFEAYIPGIHKLITSHDLVINLGDLIRETRTEEDAPRYKKVLELLNVGKPIKSVAGNHDINTFSREQLATIWGQSKLYYSFDQGGYHHIVLDGLRDVKGGPHRISEEQIQWLAEDLKNTELQVIVYCHFPLDEQSLESNYYFKGRPANAFITNRAEVRSVLENSKKVLCVFGGHLHFYGQTSINGIQYVTIPSFLENDGNHKPKAECLSVTVEGGEVRHEVVKVTP